jgi:hypothetical protein
LIAAALISIAPALAADLPLKPVPASEQADTNPLTPPTATCSEWTDGCRTCARAADGTASCSNVGIACVPKARQCTLP